MWLKKEKETVTEMPFYVGQIVVLFPTVADKLQIIDVPAKCSKQCQIISTLQSGFSNT